MNIFDQLWKDIDGRCTYTVQDRQELEYIYNLMKGASSYLEVGTAEGNSLYVLGHALHKDAEITYIDFGEEHTTEKRDQVLDKLRRLYSVTGIHGDSNDFSVMKQVNGKQFDVVLIDAGHTEANVVIDAIFYGPLARKYIFFHDVQLEPVGRAFDWYCRQRPDKKSYKVINSDTYGYGVIEI